jgi:hypothetical protein
MNISGRSALEKKLKKGDRIRRKSDGEVGTVNETGWDNEGTQLYVIVEWDKSPGTVGPAEPKDLELIVNSSIETQ